MRFPDGLSVNAAYKGHPHFWQRAMSRRHFIGTTAAATGAAATAGLWMPALVEASSITPRPIPDTVAPGLPFHVVLPGAGEPASITDFKGVVGVSAVGGTGTGIKTATGERTALLFDVDNRFMQGTYVGVSGQTHKGTIAFV